jgi:hypothetical protein
MALPYADHRDERSDCCVLARRREVRAYLGGSGTGVSQGRWARVGTHLRRFCREAACVEALCVEAVCVEAVCVVAVCVEAACVEAVCGAEEHR